MIRLTSSLLLALTLAACGGSDGSTDVGDDAEVAVRSTGAAEGPAGEILTFTVSVTNMGPAESGVVTLKHYVTGLGTLAGIACTATGDAECPGTLGPDMTVDSLPVGGGLVFTISVSTPADQLGVVTSALIASADNDPDDTNNRGESTTLTHDARNGNYIVYGSNGRQYTLSLDFEEMSYELTGQQMSRSGTFTPDPDGVSYVFEGTARFRVAKDLVVGGFPFDLTGSNHPYDHGVRPIVGARTFSTQLAVLDGQHYNLIGLNLRRNNTIESIVYPSKFVTETSQTTLQTCRAPLVLQVEKCPAEALYKYTLEVAGTEIVGADAENDDVIHFRLAQSGSTLVILRAEDAADETGRHFRVGLAETSGLAGGIFGTSDTGTAWGLTELTDTHYGFSGKRSDGTSVAVTANLASLGADRPTGLRAGLRSGDQAPIFLGQNDALMLMLGAADGLAEGTMDIGLR